MDRQAGAPRPTELEPEQLARPHRVIPVDLDDGAVIYARQHGNPDGPRLLVSHGNGLATDAYFAWWRHFLPDFEVIAYDLRNHGWNPPSDPAQHNFPTFVFDNERVLDTLDQALGSKPTLGAFHSLSALVALYQALRVGPRWAGLVLFDPPLRPPPGHRLQRAFMQGQRQLSERTARRQERYADYAGFEAVLRAAEPFAGFEPECYALYAAATFAPSEVGDEVVLRCPRQLEADVYISNQDATIALAMAAFPSPLKVIGADPSAPGPGRTCAALMPQWGVEFEALEGTSHFLQMERPAECARLARTFFADNALGLPAADPAASC